MSDRNCFRFFWSTIFMISVSCSESPVKTSSLTISLDKEKFGTNSVTVQKSSYATKSISSLDFWGVADAQEVGDINCFAVVVSGDEVPLKENSCVVANDMILRFGPHNGFFSVSEEMQFDVPAGLKRKIVLVGMASADGSCPRGIEDIFQIDRTQYSNPVILGSTTVDLLEGENHVLVPVSRTISQDLRLRNCRLDGEVDEDAPDLGNGSLTIEEIPDSFNFGMLSFGHHLTHSFRLKNESLQKVYDMKSDLSDDNFFFKGGTYPGTDGDCGTELGSGEECQIVIEFRPSHAIAGPRAVSLGLQFRGGDGADVQTTLVNLEGIVKVSDASMLVVGSGNTISFDTVWVLGGRSQASFTVTNNYGSAVSNLSLVGLDDEFYEDPSLSSDCSAGLETSMSCTFYLEFNATFWGSREQAFEVQYTMGGGTTKSISLTAQGRGT